MKWLPPFWIFVVMMTVCFGQTHPSLPRIGSLDGMGVSIHFTEPKPGELEMIRAAGFKWIRLDVLWSDTESSKGEYDFAVFDRLVAELEKHGLRALFILDYGHPLYAEPGEEFPFTRRAATEEFRRGYARWAATVVSRYAGKGFLWELWNEPNLPAFWQPQPDVQQYIGLMKAACEAIRKAAPGEAIVGPATAGIDYALPFLEACFREGLLEFFDAVSVHCYRTGAPESVSDEYRTLRRLVARYAPSGKNIPVICSEWGYSTATPNPDAQWAQYLADEATQANYLSRLMLANVANDIPLTIWYDWHDDGDDPNDEQHRFGLVRHPYREGAEQPFEPKPAYLAAQALARQLNGLHFSKCLQLPTYNEAPHPELMLFADKETEVLAAWHPVQEQGEYALPLGREPVAILDQFGIASGETASGKSGPPHGSLTGAVRFFKPAKRDPVLTLAAAWPRLPLARIAAAPIDETVDLGFSHPLSQPVRLVGGKQPIAPGEKIPGWAQFKADSRVGLHQPGQHLADRRTVTASLDLQEPFFMLVQQGDLLLTNPVEFEIGAPGPAGLPVIFTNPAATAWKGHARVRGLADSFAVPAKEPWWEVNLPAGSTTHTVILPLPASHLNQALTLQLWEKEPARHASAPVPRPLVGFSAEALSHFTYGDETVSGEIKLESASPPSDPCPAGGPVAKLTYRFGKGHKYAHVQPVSESLAKQLPPDAAMFGMWLWGDGKDCLTRIRFVDAQGQTFQSDGPQLTFNGWRFVKFALKPTADATLASWGGPQDGVAHPPLQWDTLLLLDNTSHEPVEGAVYFSAPALLP